MGRYDITLIRGDTFEETFTGLGDLTGQTEIWFTAKRSTVNTDDAADIKVSSVAGLEVINQVAATVPGNASITIISVPLGQLTVRIEAEETAKLLNTEGDWQFDIQWTDGTDVTTPRRATLTVVGDVTREIP